MYNFKEKPQDKFIRYAKIHTTSDDSSTTSPSSMCQHDLASLLANELIKMGVSNVNYDKEHCYVYGYIPANDGTENDPLPNGIGFIAHMDTSPDLSGENVNPVIHENYNGGDIKLNEEYTLSPKEFPELQKYIGKSIMTTDGTTLLGADDKAGVAEIMTLAEYLISNPEIKHPRVAIGFTPDEEIGAGTDYFDIPGFGAKYAYTVDGGGLGEIEYENFNAAYAKITIKGRNVHPGTAKNKMINSLRLAIEFNERLPKEEKPEYTEGYEGFFHLTDITGDVENTVMEYIIRDHDKTLFEQKKDILAKIQNELNEKYGLNRITVEIKDQYYNMKEKIEPVMFLIDKAKSAMESLGVTPEIIPIRGGTDGARLSYEGLPTPNLCTGGYNFHGRFEFIPVESMETIVSILVKIVESFSKK